MKLADGTSDGCISPSDMDEAEAQEWMKIHRTYYDAGLRMTDPDHVKGGPEVIQRVTREDQISLVRSIKNKGRTRPGGLVYPGE